MKKIRTLGFNYTFFIFFLCALSAFYPACKDTPRNKENIDITQQENEKFVFSKHNCLIITSKDSLHANCKNKKFTPDKFLAYSCESDHGDNETIMRLKSPFPSDNHSQSLLDIPFFEAYSKDGGLNIHSMSGVLPFWDFSKKEDRNLDYTIYHQILNFHNEIVFNQKQMKVDFLYFTPYYENETSIYVLSWNLEEDVSEIVEIKDGVVLFPVKKEKNKKIGLIISPQVAVKRNKTSITMSTNFHKSQFKFRLNFKTVDKNDKSWVLSWRKINKPSHRR